MAFTQTWANTRFRGTKLRLTDVRHRVLLIDTNFVVLGYIVRFAHSASLDLVPRYLVEI